MDAKPAYYAILPAAVRYDPDLRPNAKLLYAEITALSNRMGYCFAGNEYFAALYGITDRAVRGLIKNLSDHGYLCIELIKSDTGEIKGRRLRLTEALLYEDPDTVESPEGGMEKIFHTYGKNFPGVRKKFSADTSNNNNNNKYNNNPPQVPPQGDVPKPPKSPRKPKSEPAWKPDRFAGFWSFYPRGESRQAAVRAWDKLKPSDELIAQMGKALERQMQTEQWQRGIGIPYASTWLNGRRWEDEIPNICPVSSGWAPDPEVMPDG